MRRAQHGEEQAASTAGRIGSLPQGRHCGRESWVRRRRWVAETHLVEAPWVTLWDATRTEQTGAPPLEGRNNPRALLFCTRTAGRPAASKVSVAVINQRPEKPAPLHLCRHHENVPRPERRETCAGQPLRQGTCVTTARQPQPSRASQDQQSPLAHHPRCEGHRRCHMPLAFSGCLLHSIIVAVGN